MIFLNFFLTRNFPYWEGLLNLFFNLAMVQFKLNADLSLEHLELALEAHVREQHRSLCASVLQSDIEGPLLLPH